MTVTRRGRIVAIVAILAMAWGGRAGAENSYYVLVFGSQSRPKLVRKTHAWAAFVRVEAAGDVAGLPKVYTHAISWLPRSQRIRPLALRPEAGANFDLNQTLEWVLAQGQDVRMWGPLPIDRGLYERSLGVKQAIESGQASYKALSLPWDLEVLNCNQALRIIGPEFGQDSFPLMGSGIHAGRFFAREVVTHSAGRHSGPGDLWLLDLLGINRYPVAVCPGLPANSGL